MTPPSIQLPLLENNQGNTRELGSLILERGRQKISLPLSAVDIKAKVIDRVSEVTIKQVFKNTLTEHLEAVYIFPIAAGSAVSSFNMKVGDRSIKGVVQERAEARQNYQNAIDSGKRAALLEQERDDVFTVQVGNLPPGEEVTIEISYAERLPYFESGTSELRLPLVVAPRFIPGNELNRNPVGDGIEPDTDLVPDASRISPPRLARGVDPQTALSLKVEILQQGEVELSDFYCSQHATKTSLLQGVITVSLARADERLNRDFVLRWQSAGDSVKSSLITYQDPADGEIYGMLSIMPPKRAGYLGASRDVVFVVDRSGSMQGVKMTSAARACSILLNTLGPNDRYAIAVFDNVVDFMAGENGGYFVDADTAGLEKGEKYLRNVTARGGTHMNHALLSAFAALSKRKERDGRLPAIVVLTDGDVGNESQILQTIQTQIGDARLFVVGIDTAVNAGLLKRLANLGGGTATFVEPGVQLEEALASIGREIGAPLVSDLQVENQDLAIDRASLSPARIPDVFAGRASTCFFKLQNRDGGKLKITGQKTNGKAFEEKVRAQKVNMPCIAQLWAKAHIADLEDSYRIQPQSQQSLKKQIIELSVKHSLLTKFTAFVVVDEAEIVNKTGELRKVVQATEMPALWDMDCETVSGGAFKRLSAGYGGFAHHRSAASNSQPADMGWGGAADSWSAPSQETSGQMFCKQEASPPQSPSRSRSPRPQSAPQPAASAASPPAPPAPPAPAAADKAKDNPASLIDNLKNLLGGGKPREDSARDIKDSCQKIVGETTELRAKKLDMPTPDSIRELTKAKEAAIPQSNESVFAKQLTEYAASPHARKQAPELVFELTKARNQLDQFFAEFKIAFDEVESDNSPDPAKLESARLNLLQTLAPMKLGMELKLLQRFLRATAIELIASVKDNSVTKNDLKAFWQSKKEVFDDVANELEALLSGKEAAFWDGSI